MTLTTTTLITTTLTTTTTLATKTTTTISTTTTLMGFGTVEINLVFLDFLVYMSCNPSKLNFNLS